MTETLLTIEKDAIELLQKLVQTPSFSKEEGKTADLLVEKLGNWGLSPQRQGKNVWAIAPHFSAKKPTIWLNSHHDSVKPSSGYTRDPFDGKMEEGRLFGLGSNDAGGALVSMLAAFRALAEEEQPFNLVFLASAEEEISGAGGISSVLTVLPKADLVVVGEPTLLKAAIAEKGLMVLDCTLKGTAGHAARQEGVNAIYKAMPDLAWFRDFRFPKISPTLGEVHMSVTVIEAGSQHNVVPDLCRFTVDVRATDAYSLDEILAIVQAHVQAEVVPRSLRLGPSATPQSHSVMAAIQALGLETYGSPTLSDQALIPYPSVKLGPGDSARSHQADEFIYVAEISQAIPLYISLLENTYK